MLAELSNDVRNVPAWLATASADDELPLTRLLHGSMFYPACGLDGRPVQYFGGAVHSFVYVDQAVSRQDVIQALEFFKGYRLLFVKDVNQDALGRKSFERHEKVLNEHGDMSRGFNSSYFSYAIWAVLERQEGFGPDHGPVRFSLLYIGGEAVSAYWSLYWRLRIAPFAITLIKCDGFTGNWTSFFDDGAELATLVRLSVRLSAELNSPKYLFSAYQGRDAGSPWRWFSERVKSFHSVLEYGGGHHQHLTVWRFRRDTPSGDLSERKDRGRARAELLDEELQGSSRNDGSRQRSSASFPRHVINGFLERGVNPLEAVFFNSKLSGGCLDLHCGLCRGRPLNRYLKVMSRAEILSDLGCLETEAVVRYEKEIRATLIYIDAGHLNLYEMAELDRNGVQHILYKMIEHHAMRLEKSRVVARLERERYLKARQRRAELATERLPNAIRRNDKLAVRALIRKGANPDYVEFDGTTARMLALKLGVSDWLPTVTPLRPRYLAQKSHAGNDLHPRPLILGLGTAGEAIATRLQRGTFLLDQPVGVDVSGFGWYSTGLDCSEYDRESIERGIALASKVLFVVFGGGTKSTEMARFAASCAQFKNVKLDVILSIPMSWEGRKRAAKATSLLEFLRDMGANVTTVVSDHYHDQDEEDFRVMFSRVDDAMLKEVQAWAATASEVGCG